MIGLPLGTRVWIAAGVTDMRKGMDGLAALVQTALGERPYSGDVFIFRGRRGDLLKLLWWSGDGMNLYAKRLERGRFVWPQATSGVVHLTAAQLSMLLEGIDWRRPDQDVAAAACGVSATHTHVDHGCRLAQSRFVSYSESRDQHADAAARRHRSAQAVARQSRRVDREAAR